MVVIYTQDFAKVFKTIEDARDCIFDVYSEKIGIEAYKAVASAGRKGEAYMVDYNGGRRRLDMHIKGGKSMNSSDARERFRIYYFWDDDDQRVVIGYLPDHLPLSGI